MAHGIDVASDVTDSLDCIVAKGITFVMRYYSQNSDKALSAKEVEAIKLAGLYIGTVYEDGPTQTSYFTSIRGTQDAKRAEEQAQNVGQPDGTTIYFAVDFDVVPMNLWAIINYFQAVKEQLAISGKYNAGCYGSGFVCQHLLQVGLATRTWLALSKGWLGYAAFKSSGDWNILQLDEIPQNYCDLDVDTDLTQGNGGGW